MEDFVGTQEAVELTGYSEHYIRELLREGKVKGRQVSRVWLIDRNDLLAYLKRMKEEPRGGPRKGTDT